MRSRLFFFRKLFMVIIFLKNTTSSWIRLVKYMLVYEIRTSKMKFFSCQGIFRMNFDWKNGCKNEFKDNNEKSWSWSRNKILTKSISKLYGRATAMPPAWELTSLIFCYELNEIKIFIIIRLRIFLPSIFPLLLKFNKLWLFLIMKKVVGVRKVTFLEVGR